MSDLQYYAEQIFKRCDDLSLISQNSTFIDRRYLTPEHKRTNQQVARWMNEAGMRTWQDEAGNQWSSYPACAENAPTVILGSHLDTVPNSGKYDGILGVLMAVSLAQYFHDQHIKLPFNLEIVGFGDEEGTRFGTTLLGSCAVAGSWQEKWASLTDTDNTCLAQAMQDFGLDINKISNASRARDNISAYLEVHIEQGPVLEARRLPVGIVSAISGARRFNIHFRGMAGHAGTVPMSMRKDALVAASEAIVGIEKLAREYNVVATVGRIDCAPGAVNVIPGSAEFSLDIRSENDNIRDDVVSRIHSLLDNIVQSRNIQMSIEQTHSADAVLCDPSLQAALQNAIEMSEMQSYTLSSGAGHDAMAMADICPVAMLFTRCEKGISHNPAESVTVTDIKDSLTVLKQFFQNYSA